MTTIVDGLLTGENVLLRIVSAVGCGVGVMTIQILEESHTLDWIEIERNTDWLIKLTNNKKIDANVLYPDIVRQMRNLHT